MGTPRTFRCAPIALLSLFAILQTTFAQQVEQVRDSPASSIESLRDLAVRILNDKTEVGCLDRECKILVVNFVMPNGINPLYGSVLADELCTQIASLKREVQVFDRGLLKIYTAITNSSGSSLKNDADARELARGLGANAVVTGTATKLSDNSLKLSVRLLSVKDASVSHAQEALVPPVPANLPEETQAPARVSDPRSSTPPTQFPSGNKKFAVPGKDGVSIPSCFYMPNPPYTKEAKDAKFSGIVLVEGVVNLDGKVTNIRILKPEHVGLGMDESIIKTLKTWTCKPAIGPNGKPVPVIVPFEMNFRLY